MENGKIASGAITASSYHDSGLTPNLARLNSASAWSVANQPRPHWLQVDLGRVMAVKKVATQGRRLDSHSQWVTSYKISSSVDGIDWVVYAENSVVKVSQLYSELFICSYITAELSL